MRVIGADGSQLGILPTREALKIAQEVGFDLVEVAATAKPPVCKIMDYGKYKYEQEKKKREAKKHQTVIRVKEVKLRPATDRHDFDVKLRHVREFLEDGNKAKITVRFRGREMAHRDLGMEILQRMIKEIGELGKIDQFPKFEGRMLTAVLSPNPAAPKKQKEKGETVHAKNEEQ